MPWGRILLRLVILSIRGNKYLVEYILEKFIREGDEVSKVKGVV